MNVLERIKSLVFSTKQNAMSPAPAVGIEDMLPAVVTFGLIAIVAAVIALVLTQFVSTEFTGINAYSCNVAAPCIAYNSLQFGLQGIQTMTSFLSLIALVIVAAVIIGVVLLAFSFGGRGGGRTF